MERRIFEDFLISPRLSCVSVSTMDSSDCPECKEAVSENTTGICCERCEDWYHQSCVNVESGRAQSRLLQNVLIVFLCVTCLKTSKEEWKKKKEDKETQTEAGLTPETAPPVAPEASRAGPDPTTEKTPKEDRGVQTNEARPKSVKMAVKKTPIRIIGDSMVKNTNHHVKCRMEGSGCTSMSGAQIGNIRKKVEEEAAGLKDGLLIIQGGGNGLQYVGQEETVREVVSSVKAAAGRGNKVAVVGILRRPREDRHYEELRRSTNKAIQEELLAMKMEWMREKKGDVSFIDMDRLLEKDASFATDGVHLSESGNRRLGLRLCEWVKMKSLRPVGSPRPVETA